MEIFHGLYLQVKWHFYVRTYAYTTNLYVGQHHSVDIQNKLQAVEIFNETKRYREERVLLIGEMNNLLRFYHGVVLPSISQSISGTRIRTYIRMYIEVHTYVHRSTYVCTYV